ncbi:TetR/AcrR family transcriptional regulator [Verticiella sediminum]|uniref:TetR/AcrR family transcriptional regulator n=1 Tax=Verticiella sediminum TaxID=1247510 RepID=A0A556A7X6_9BURK|nr:TetR/AcrR family transcriptional regulator [Verticiella sediminum]TSH88986.1 TetR/AcrR family transcriptional regulator [Verticiella sediminum]
MSPPSRHASRKGEHTRVIILDHALRLAGAGGIDALTIGTLAESASMSKSGVFAHFGSREDLQIAVVQEYHQRFQQRVFEAAMREPRGLPRVQALFDGWIAQATDEIEQGCIYLGGAFEYDDRPGPVRDALAASITVWRGALVRACAQAVACGHMRTDTDTEQLVFELMGLILALHMHARFLKHADALARTRQGVAHRLAQTLATPA